MRKAAFIFVVMMVGIPLFFAGCNKTKTYAERLKDEKKAIERFMDKKGYYLVSKLPPDTVFTDPNAFYRTREGLYIHVINKRYNPSGAFKNDTIALGDPVAVRFWKKQKFMVSDAIYSCWGLVGEPPVVFIRGKAGDLNVPKGWDIALNYVNNWGLVRLIIPSIIGDIYDSDTQIVSPVFYDSVWFKLSY